MSSRGCGPTHSVGEQGDHEESGEDRHDARASNGYALAFLRGSRPGAPQKLRVARRRAEHAALDLARSLLGASMDLRHILVPIDFEEASRAALELACELAAKLDAKLTLLHSFYVPLVAYGYDTMLFAADWATASRAELEALTANTKRRHAKTEGVWLEGDPRLRILEVTRDRSVDLIVAGTHGRRGFSRLLFGSVAGRLVRTSPVPLITTAGGAERESLRPQIRHILVATDFGDPAREALAYACDLARRFDARITLVHVLPPTLPQIGRGLPAEFLPADEARTAMAAELERVKERVMKADSILAEGDPREQILRIAAECRADMLVMGTHARRGVPRYLLGSVAETVVRCAEIPVLTMTCEVAQSKSSPD